MTRPRLDVITPVSHDLGDFKVRRTLPAKSRTMVGPFIFDDQRPRAQHQGDCAGGELS